MGSRRICVYGLDESAVPSIPGYHIVARLHTRSDLRLAISADDIEILIVDLDMGSSLDAIVETIEIQPDLAVVGVTASNDVEFVFTAQRTGCRQITSKPVDLDNLTVAIRQAGGEVVQGPTAAQTIAVIGAVGGAGVTTIACSLTMALAETTESTAAIVDLDFAFGGVARAWDLRPRYTIADINATGAAEPYMIEDAVVEMPGRVRVLACPQTIEQGASIDESAVTRILQTMKRMYSYVILDLPRQLDSVTGCAIQACDRLVVVLQLTVPAIDNGRRFVEALGRFGIPNEKVEFVVNRYRKNVHTLTTDCVEDKLGKKPLAVLPNDYRSVAAALDVGKPISSRSAFPNAVRNLATKLSETSEEHHAGKKRWLAGLKRRG